MLHIKDTVIWENFVVIIFRRAREQQKLTHKLLTIIKTTIIYGMKLTCTFVQSIVHEYKFNAMYRSTEYLLPPVTVEDNNYYRSQSSQEERTHS